MKVGLLKIVANSLHSQAQEIDVNAIKDKVAIKIWDITVEVARLFSNDLEAMGSDIGRILAYRYQEDEDFREKVNKIIEKVKKIELD